MKTKINKKLIILITIFFIQGIVTNIHHPLTPAYVANIGLPKYVFGFFFAFMNIGMMLGGPFWGNLGDSGKKKFAVVAGLSIYGISQALFGMDFIFSQWPLTLIRIFSGFGIAASFVVINSEIITTSKPGKRARNIAFGAAALGMGGAIGQFLGGFINNNKFVVNLLGTDSFTNVVYLQGAVTLLLALFVFIVFKPEEVVKDKNKKRTYFWEGFKEIKNVSKELLFFLLSLTFITMAATNVDKFFDDYYNQVLGYGTDKLGNFKMIIGFVTVGASLFLVPLFMKIKKKLFLISIFQVISGVLVFITFRATGSTFLLYLYTLYMAYIVIKAVYAPLEQEHISTFADDTNITTTLGIRQSFLSVGTIIGPIAGGFIYEKSPQLLFDTSVILFFLSVGLIFVSSLLRKKNGEKNII